jgi:act minimal PKS chain-length factor (CLF/KS beta)
MTRPVITGLGVTAPTGCTVESHWQAVLDGKSGIDHITRFDTTDYPVKLAGQVRDFDASEKVSSRLLRETDLMTHFAFVATQEALADADIDTTQWQDFELSVVTANSSAGAQFGQSELQKLYAMGPKAVGAYMAIAWFYAATTGQLSIRHGMRGPCGVLATEQAGGLDSLGHSRRALQKGARVVVAGGSDASLTPYGVVAQSANGLLTRSGNLSRAFVPFDAEAAGYVPGEGGAIVVVEDGDSARQRGARVHVELAGYAATFDPRPGSDREPGLRRAAELAIRDAGLRPDEIDVVFADGYGVPRLDREEAQALAALFGPRGVPVTVPKTMTGRLYAGGAALDVVNAILAVRDSVVPPTVHVEELAPGIALDLVRAPRELTVRHALVLARGYGGFNAAVVLSAVR